MWIGVKSKKKFKSDSNAISERIITWYANVIMAKRLSYGKAQTLTFSRYPENPSDDQYQTHAINHVDQINFRHAI